MCRRIGKEDVIFPACIQDRYCIVMCREHLSCSHDLTSNTFKKNVKMIINKTLAIVFSI